MEASEIGQIMLSAFSVLVISYIAQEQADRYNNKIARFFQRFFTVAIISSAIILAVSIIVVISKNN